MRAQAFQNKDQMATMSGRKVLEVNPYHPVIYDLYEKIQEDAESETAARTVEMLWQAALLEGGYEISDPSALVKRIYSLMSSELGVTTHTSSTPAALAVTAVMRTLEGRGKRPPGA